MKRISLTFSACALALTLALPAWADDAKGEITRHLQEMVDALAVGNVVVWDNLLD